MAYVLSEEDKAAIAAAGAAYNAAKTDEERAKAHSDAEAIRAKAGYSGGADGSQYIPLGTTSSGYTAKGTFNDAIMNPDDQAAVKDYGQKYNEAIAAGNRDLANYWHDQAEAKRAGYGYSGGTDGSEYIKLAQETPAATGGGFSYGSAPTYSDNYSARIDAMLNQILNRDEFSYNAAEDDLYQQYAQQYQREGKRAMQDTLGQVAARTGGMASSYATSAAAQANNYYASQLADKIPELYQLAYEMYLDDIELQVQDLGLLNDASDRQYGRFRDTMSDWRDDRNFAYNMYRDDIADNQWQTSFDYNAERDQVADDQWAANFGYNAYRDTVADDQWNKTFEYGKERDEVADSQWQQMFDRDVYESDRDYSYKVSQDKEQKLESSGYVYDPDSGEYVPSEESDDEPNDGDADLNWDSVNDLGIGPKNATFLLEIKNLGGIVEDGKGNVKWAPGWNASNYLEKMEAAKKWNGLTLPTIPDWVYQG